MEPDNSTDVVPGGNDAVRGEVSAKIGEVISLNIAITDTSADTVKVQVFAVPLHGLDHPPNVTPASGVSVSVTDVPFTKKAEQTVGHDMPAGDEETEPVPVPLVVIERV